MSKDDYISVFEDTDELKSDELLAVIFEYMGKITAEII